MNMYIPPRDAFGVRQTVNYGLSTPQTVWNLRSGLNVAALNCVQSQYAAILPAYASFLDGNKKALNDVNTQLRRAYTSEHGSDWRPQFDRYMTQVYNYYALPPAQTQFCDAALEVANAYTLTPDRDLNAFAMAYLPRLEQVFTSFYSALERYRGDVVAWDAEYAPPSASFANNYDNTGISGGSILPQAVGRSMIRDVPVAPSSAQAAPTYTAPENQPVIGPVASANDPGFLDQPTAQTVPEAPFENTPGSTNTQQPVFVSNPVVEPIPTPADETPGTD
ncbi:MAG: hypothetical protein WA948_06245 [Pontixanthobacter sp.]